MDVLISFLVAFALTAAIEGAIVLAVFRRPVFVYYSVLWNLLTNPALGLGLSLAAAYWRVEYWFAVLVGEVCVFVVEGFLIRALLGLPLGRALLLSLVLNTASLVLGLVLFW